MAFGSQSETRVLGRQDPAHAAGFGAQKQRVIPVFSVLENGD